MKMTIFKKILFAIFVLNLLQSCGYQPLLTDQNQNFSISAVSESRGFKQMVSQAYNKADNGIRSE